MGLLGIIAGQRTRGEMEPLDPTTSEFWQMIGYVFACGGVVGLERQLRGKPAGIRTSILIVMGTTVFVALGGVAADAGGDHARVLGQVVTGVGFLGAGVIMNREGVVVGVTTAAIIWVLAASGACIGSGYPRAGLAIALLAVTVVAGMELLESTVLWFGRGVHARTRELLGGPHSGR